MLVSSLGVKSKFLTVMYVSMYVCNLCMYGECVLHRRVTHNGFRDAVCLNTQCSRLQEASMPWS